MDRMLLLGISVLLCLTVSDALASSARIDHPQFQDAPLPEFQIRAIQRNGRSIGLDSDKDINKNYGNKTVTLENIPGKTENSTGFNSDAGTDSTERSLMSLIEEAEQDGISKRKLVRAKKCIITLTAVSILGGGGVIILIILIIRFLRMFLNGSSLPFSNLILSILNPMSFITIIFNLLTGNANPTTTERPTTNKPFYAAGGNDMSSRTGIISNIFHRFMNAPVTGKPPYDDHLSRISDSRDNSVFINGVSINFESAIYITEVRETRLITGEIAIEFTHPYTMEVVQIIKDTAPVVINSQTHQAYIVYVDYGGRVFLIQKDKITPIQYRNNNSKLVIQSGGSVKTCNSIGFFGFKFC